MSPEEFISFIAARVKLDGVAHFGPYLVERIMDEYRPQYEVIRYSVEDSDREEIIAAKHVIWKNVPADYKMGSTRAMVLNGVWETKDEYSWEFRPNSADITKLMLYAP